MQSKPGSATVDLAAYLSELDRVRTTIAIAETAEEAHAIAAAFPDRLWVNVDAHVVVVDTRWLDETVGRGTWTADRESILQRLTTMTASASEVAVDPERPAQEALRAVLARPEFQRQSQSRWLSDVRRRVGEWLLQLLDRFGPSGVTGRIAALVFAWIVSIGALIALAFWVVTVLLRRSDAARLELGTAPPPRTPARQWAQRALDAIRAGDLREAVRCAYHTSICRLEEQGVWSVDETRTPREYLSLLHREDARYPVLVELTHRFEQVWYGYHSATMEDAQRLSAHLERLGCVHVPERATGRS